jgi:hypothetical protein
MAWNPKLYDVRVTGPGIDAVYRGTTAAGALRAALVHVGKRAKKVRRGGGGEVGEPAEGSRLATSRDVVDAMYAYREWMESAPEAPYWSGLREVGAGADEAGEAGGAVVVEALVSDLHDVPGGERD